MTREFDPVMEIPTETAQFGDGKFLQTETDLFHGALIDLLTKDLTPELISLSERESSYPEENILIISLHLILVCQGTLNFYIYIRAGFSI